MTRPTVLSASAAVEGLDELGGGEVADPVPGLDGGVAEGDEEVALAGAGGADQADVLRGADPFEDGEVVERRWRDRGRGDVELVEGLGDRERGVPQPGAGVGLVAGGDLGLDQGAQELLGGPPLGLGGDQQLGGEAAHRGQLQPLQPAFEVGGQRRRCGAVTAVLTCRSRRRPATGSAPTAASAPAPARPGGAAVRRRPAARIERTSAARHRPNATARSSAASSASAPWAACRVRISPSSLRQLASPRPRRRRSGTPRRPSPRAQELLLGRGSGLAAPGAACPGAGRRSGRRRCWSHPARPAGARRRPRR